MSAENKHTYPKLHNAAWPGLVGKGSPDAEPVIEFETIISLPIFWKQSGPAEKPRRRFAMVWRRIT